MSEDGDVDNILDFKRKDVSGIFQRFRAKQNIEYTFPSGVKFFAKVVNKRSNSTRDNIEGLKREKYFLDYLSDTGVVPKAGELKVYPNGTRARLLLEKLGGDSLGRKKDPEGLKIMKRKPADVIISSATSHQGILNKGVCVVDVNPGTYVIDEVGGKVATKIVDFELALFMDEKLKYDTTLRWYRANDPWLRLSGKGVNIDNPRILKQEDIHLWASTMVDALLGSTAEWNIFSNSSHDRTEEYSKAGDSIRPMFESEIANETQQNYRKFNPGGNDEEEKRVVNYSVKSQTPLQIRDALKGLVLDEELRSRNIDLPPTIVGFLKRALGPDIEQRPDSFDEILEQ